jgi:hypothetical protein
LHNICAIFFLTFKFFVMPGKDNELNVRTDKPEADRASKQNAHVDHSENMGEVEPEYRSKADKALRKNVDSNKQPDNVKTNSDGGGSAKE